MTKQYQQGVFGYGSLVDETSAKDTLEVEEITAVPAKVRGWRRDYSVARKNKKTEKMFATREGKIPGEIILLNLVPDPDVIVNGVVVVVSDEDLHRLDQRELRYQRVEISSAVEAEGATFDKVYTYIGKPKHQGIKSENAIVISAYKTTVEEAFRNRGGDWYETYVKTTTPPSVPVVEAVIVSDQGPKGNPKDW